jgi:alkanesulfonate monooxygenase SsuD/methylene tetrahydromethanopterin reductase-like flavin-dependent oxidoreductase (luciferase family)
MFGRCGPLDPDLEKEFAVPDYGNPLEFGVFPEPLADPPDRVERLVGVAERSGLDLIGIQDHPYQRRFYDTWTLISYLAARTEKVRFCPDVANLPLRSPVMLAKAAASLDVLTRGRDEFGLGAGASATAPPLPPSAPIVPAELRQGS